MMMLQLLFLILLIACAQSFITSHLYSNRLRLWQAVEDSPGADPLEAIKQKMAADPNYNPMQDPEAMQTLEGMISPEMREVSGAIQRLKVAFTDATTGEEAATLQQLEEFAASSDKKELISAPNSDFIKGGMTEDVDYNESKLQELLDQLKSENPEVPEK